MTDIMNDKNIEGLAYRFAVYKDFWNWCNDFHPTILNDFKAMNRETDNLLKALREKDVSTGNIENVVDKTIKRTSPSAKSQEAKR